MAEFITYGGNQLSNQDFLNKASNELEPYLARQPWSNKRKELFRKAYSNIMKQGVTGADNSSGTWKVQYEGTPIDIDSLSKKEREMYGEAAYYIQQQMAGLTPISKEEENKKDRIKFDNDYFTTSLSNHIASNTFGGSKWSTQEDWNVLDERNKQTGLRGTDVRRQKLADSLDSYLKSLNQDEITFEGGPFKDYDDFNTRINRAILALRNNSDIRDSLNAIGLKEREWLYNGADDTFTDENGNTITYADYAKQQTKKVQQEQPQQKLNIWKTSIRMNGRNPRQLAEKYKNDQGLKDALNGFYAKGKLTPDELSELLGAFKYYNSKGALTNISDEEKTSFSKLRGYENISPNTLKKLDGVNGYYFDTRTNQVISFNNMSSTIDLLNQENPETQQQNYLNSTKPDSFTSAEWEELASIGLDIASIIDVEPASAAGLGLAAAAARHHAINQTPGHKWTLTEGIGQGIDYATALVGAIPLFGDATLLAKMLVKARPILTKVGRLATWKDIIDATPAIGSAYNKFMNGEDLTVQDWRLIAQGIRGIVSHGKMNRLNRAERTALQESGTPIETKNGLNPLNNEFTRKLGLYRTEVSKGKTSTVKAKIEGKDREIEISEGNKAELETKLRKAGNDVQARKKAIAETPEVKKALADAGKTIDDLDIDAVSGISSSRWNPLNHFNWYKGGTDQHFGTTTKNITYGEDNFNNFINQQRSWWNKMKYGTNTELRHTRRYLESNGSILTQPSAEEVGLPKGVNVESYYNNRIGDNTKIIHRAGVPINPNKDLSGTIKLGDDFSFEIKGGTLTIKNTSTGKVVETHEINKSNYSANVRQLVSQFIKKQRDLDISTGKFSRRFSKEFIDNLKQLKKQGFLYKQGGILAKDNLEFIKNYRRHG